MATTEAQVLAMQLKFKSVAVYETSAQGVLGLEQRLPH
jgi:hypothetical protein